ncbi:unnamed protein product [Rotaria sp. Silwood2]|nr:unnamed protein product [Rotaria sp. Silwood2]CAF4342178.1 unnamed protein product [Rotaria sp. Silwood2]
MYPSLETYDKLFDQHSATIQCPCTQLSISYGKFLNVSFILHQVCSSDLISPDWLNYLYLFHPSRIPYWTETDFSRDFRTIGMSYFQILSNFCSLAQINIQESQQSFTNTPLVNEHLLSRSIFDQQNKAVTTSFISETHHNFGEMLNVANITGRINQFVTGANLNCQIKMNNDSTISINDVLLYPYAVITHTSFLFGAQCSCGTMRQCLIRPIVYTNGSDLFDFVQVFQDICVGCIPLLGFLASGINWWYDRDYLENIQATYAILIDSRPPPILKPLNQSVPTRFYNKFSSDLLNEMLLENVTISDQHFDVYYSECAPISCSYTINGVRNITSAVLLFISVCGGLNQGLRIVVPWIGMLIFILIEKWRNRKTARGKHTFLT